MGPGMVGYLVGGPEINIEMKNGRVVVASTGEPEMLIRALTESNNQQKRRTFTPPARAATTAESRLLP